jgi:cytochrome c oxidase subunit 3
MNAAGLLRAGHGAIHAAGYRRDGRITAASVALWALIGVGSALFSLFIAAYVMRMEGSDWHPIAMPWQLWLNTALLVAGSVTLQRAGAAARAGQLQRTRVLLLASGACALGFLAGQLWAWQAMHAIRVMPAGNPAGSFFYLLTAMHGLHVAGGLAAWGLTARSAWRDGDPAHIAWRIALCARYWHFLLALWLVLFATLGWLTPEIVRLICGTR